MLPLDDLPDYRHRNSLLMNFRSMSLLWNWVISETACSDFFIRNSSMGMPIITDIWFLSYPKVFRVSMNSYRHLSVVSLGLLKFIWHLYFYYSNYFYQFGFPSFDFSMYKLMPLKNRRLIRVLFLVASELLYMIYGTFPANCRLIISGFCILVDISTMW
jgi:hypothetical protein